MRPLAFEIDNNVAHAQAYGCWFYLQLGSFAVFCGSRMPYGLRFVWVKRWPRVGFRRFDQCCGRPWAGPKTKVAAIVLVLLCFAPAAHAQGYGNAGFGNVGVQRRAVVRQPQVVVQKQVIVRQAPAPRPRGGPIRRFLRRLR